MRKYEKIDTLYVRDTTGTKKLIEGQFRDPTVEFLAPCEWIWTEKVDGCLRNDTKLLQTNGEYITIKAAVDAKKPIEIYGYKDGKVVPTKVLAFHNNGNSNEWYKIKFSRRGLGTKGSSYSTIETTANHKFFINGNYKRADELKIGDKVTYMREEQLLTFIQEQILIGLILGDGSISDEGKSIEFSHKIDYESYTDWILTGLGSLAGNKQSIRKSGYGSQILPARTISHSSIENLSKRFFKNGEKYIPDDLILSPVTLAVLYCDDGNLSHSEGQLDRCIIHLNDYNEESINNFISIIQRQYGITPVKLNNKGWNIRFNSNEALALQTFIAPYICDCMQYKLSPEFQNKFIGNLSPGINETLNKTFETEILDIEIKHENHFRYDLTTETHNYFANGVLVHNCNIRVYWDGHIVTFGGRTDNASIPAELVTRLNELFGGEANAQMFEQMFGEKEVILFGEGYGRKIQKGGGNYIPDGVDFILFDVLIGENYLERANVEDIARAMGIKVVPIIGSGSLFDAAEYVKIPRKSVVAEGRCDMEGLVCRPKMEMRDRRGNRLIVKVKYCDMKELA